MDDVLAAAAGSDRAVVFPPPATAHETPALEQAGRAARAADEMATKTPRRAVRSARARIAAATCHVWTFPRRQGFFGLVPVAVMYTSFAGPWRFAACPGS